MRVTEKVRHESGERQERDDQQPVAENNWDDSQQDRRSYEWNSVANHCF
jgi:hypothetical protein